MAARQERTGPVARKGSGRRPLFRLLFGSTLGLLGALLVPPAALAIDEFAVPTPASKPAGIALGPDGALWFTEEATSANRIGRISTTGAVQEFAVPTPAPPPSSGQPAETGPAEIVAGPDGALWFTELGADQIGRITPAGVVTNEYPLPSGSQPDGIVLGPDLNLWFTAFGRNRVGRMTPGGALTEFSIPTSGSGPGDIAVGPDGRLWFTESNANKIGAITTGGGISEYPIPTAASDPSGITASGGALWFTEFAANQIGRITTVGTVTNEYPAGPGPSSITTGPDGALWFTETLANKIGRITTTGSVIEFAVPTPASDPGGIAAGPDGALWFTEFLAGKIGRVQAVGPAPPAPPALPTPLPTVVPAAGQARRACRVPKVRGLGPRQAKKKLRRAGCRYRIRGTGKVVSTRPRAGKRTATVVQVKARRKRR